MTKGFKLSFMTILCVASIGTITPAFSAPSQQQSLDGIAAVVNNSVITDSELNQAIYKTKLQLSSMHATIPDAAILRKQVLNQLINRKIELDLAQQAGINVTNGDIDQALASIANSNHITQTQLLEAVTKQGYTVAQYRAELREQITISRLQNQVIGPKITVSPEEVNAYLRTAASQGTTEYSYHLEDLVIALPENPSPQDIAAAKKQADDIVTQLQHGLAFKDAVVKESSGDKALSGGDLGWRKLPEIPTAFAGLVQNAKQNQILGPVQTANGFHILRVAGIKAVGNSATGTIDRKQVQELIYERKYEEALQNWLTSIRSEAYVNITPA